MSRSLEISRREFLAGVLGLGCNFAAGRFSGLLGQENKVVLFEKEAQILDEIWRGEINPTFLEIEGYAAGQIQVREWNSKEGRWDDEYPPAFSWIHRYPNDPLAFRGFFFIHRSSLRLVDEKEGLIPWNNKLRIYANWNHDLPVLEARIGFRAIYSASKVDQPSDPLVKRIASSQRTIAIVTCHPPDFEGDEPPKRLVYFAWVNLPKSGNK